MVNVKAQKYKVYYYPDRDKPTTGKQKNFNCGLNAMQFALQYPSTVMVGNHYIYLYPKLTISGLWCEYHERNEYF